MKKTIIILAAIALFFLPFACEKQAIHDPQDDKNELIKIIQTMGLQLSSQTDLHEFDDSLITEQDLITLAPKMGMSIPRARAWCIHYQQLFAVVQQEFPQGFAKTENADSFDACTECQNGALEKFLGLMTACVGSSVLTGPFAGIYIGTCGTWALITYNNALAACARLGYPCHAYIPK